jgi:hypothetical protein
MATFQASLAEQPEALFTWSDHDLVRDPYTEEAP